MKNYCKYANVFHGNGEVDHYPQDGIASKWFYIKALCGNTLPHAVLPFGKMSVGPFSGGYPGGYGTHYPNSCGTIPKFDTSHKVRGFSHIHQSGTGAIGYYYNYAITAPFYGELGEDQVFHDIKNEQGTPGYYSCEFNDIACEVTVNRDTAYHRYSFKKEGGRLSIDFSNDGLNRIMRDRFAYIKDGRITLDGGCILFEGVFSGVKLYFCAKAAAPNLTVKLYEGTAVTDETVHTVADNTLPFGAVCDFDGSEVSVLMSYSTVSSEKAAAHLKEAEAVTFEEAKQNAHNIWNETLSVIDIESDDEEFKEKFYSNLYHSLIKPVDMTGENIRGVKDDTVAGIATFWDQYKTVYPLIYATCPDMAKKLAAGIANISRTHGRILCSFGLTDICKCEEQAKMLGIISLCDAYRYGIDGVTPELIDKCIEREFAREDFESFHNNGVFARYTHIIDATDACLDAAEITKNPEMKAKLLKLAENWRNAYDDDGIMSQNSPYYEGDRWTYSFRLQKNMDDRIALAGGKERFIELLDTFFGYGAESINQLDHMNSRELNEFAATFPRFEGFNNECDMETPYAYIYAGRIDRTCEIIHDSVKKTFTTGRGGLPGNNDSGGLSSCFVWNVLGIFPVTGAGEFLCGSPHVKSAKIRLSNGNTLEIATENLSDDNFTTESVTFDGEAVNGFRISTERLMQGGKLVFRMK